MTTALINGKILDPTTLDGDSWLDGYAVIIEGDKIIALTPFDQIPQNIQTTVDLNGLFLVPGFFDTQVNGGGGVLFNDEPSVETLMRISDAHRQYGTTSMLPTLISDDFDKMEAAISAVDTAIKSGVPGIAGIHLEGPFLNPERKGVHNENKFKIIDQKAIDLLTSLKYGKTLVTLAPEQTDPATIAQLSDAGIVIAAGHTAANYDQTKAALANGLSSFTHLFNAMTPMTSREPGVVGAALEDTKSWCGIIVDGYHVHPTTLKNALAAKAANKMILVTDAMPTVGASEKQFQLNGETIVAKNGRCATASGTLAGSDLDMLAAIKNTISLLGVSPAESVRMASLYPAEMIGLSHQQGSIAAGHTASLLALDAHFDIQQIWINGTLQ